MIHIYTPDGLYVFMTQFDFTSFSFKYVKKLKIPYLETVWLEGIGGLVPLSIEADVLGLDYNGSFMVN